MCPPGVHQSPAGDRTSQGSNPDSSATDEAATDMRYRAIRRIGAGGFRQAQMARFVCGGRRWFFGDEKSFARCDTSSISPDVLPDERILSHGSDQSRHPRSFSLTQHGTVRVSLMISPLTWPNGLGSLNPRIKSVRICSHRIELHLQSASLGLEWRVAIRLGRQVRRLTRDCVAVFSPRAGPRRAHGRR
jgi:hypothetical protein